MTHPTIHHLNDVLPSIAGRSEFVHAQRDGYSVIDYNFALADSFDDPMRLECRGIKFAPDGSILARPLHKFFNVNERADTQAHLLPFHEPHTITEKMDGSMIHPAIVNGRLVLMTRMGRTDHAIKAERHITPKMEDACRYWIGIGRTPIFEWTAPDNRVVVRYPDSRLTLLAMRTINFGEYEDRYDLGEFAREAGVDLVPSFSSDWNSGQAFVDFARAVRGKEGFVIQFTDGTWVKAKGDDYVLKHKAKESILQEKNVLALVLRGELDDVIPLLDSADQLEVTEYQVKVLLGVEGTAERLRAFVAANDNLDQKQFAVQAVPGIAPGLRPLAFQVRAGAEAVAAVKGALLKAVGSQTSVDASRHLHGARFAL